MAVVRTKALILRHTTDREHDRLLTILTPTMGQLRVRARGTKKGTSKLGGSLEPLMEVDLNLADGRAIETVTGSIILQRFDKLRQDVVSMTMSQWLLELVEAVTKPEQPEHGLYDLVIARLTMLADAASRPAGQRWLMLCQSALLILQHEGFVPPLDACAVCHRALLPEEVAYDPQQGFVHQHEAAASARKLSATTVHFFRDGTWPEHERTAWQETHGLLEQVIHHTLDRPLKSEGVLRAIVRLAKLPKTA
ncbi:MAG: DNA repair protein RecO [Candidatus Kerfeldbacteria bacterium]|nr:DNA repair protein RecO [Candidatus Kerfeldbacteria bacterium]